MNKFLLLALLALSTPLFAKNPVWFDEVRLGFAELADMPEKEREMALSRLELDEISYEHLSLNYNLNWKWPGHYKLPLSLSTLSLPNDYMLLLGKDIQTGLVVNGASKNEQTEAYICAIDNILSPILFSYYPTGYISIDNWDNLNPNKCLELIVKDNIKDLENGTCELRISGWAQEPILDRTNMTIHWALNMWDDEENVVNAYALKLGRNGIEFITWIIPRAYNNFAEGYLNTLLRAHFFNPGDRYEDYAVGDPIADYGVDAIIGATISGDVNKSFKFLHRTDLLKSKLLIFCILVGIAIALSFLSKRYYKK